MGDTSNGEGTSMTIEQELLALRREQFDEEIFRTFEGVPREDTLRNQELVNATGCLNWTLLHKAIMRGTIKSIRFLLERGANVNVKDGQSRFPIHLAVQHQSLEVVQLLVEYGADVKTPTGGLWGTPLDCARSQYINKPDIALWLEWAIFCPTFLLILMVFSEWAVTVVTDDQRHQVRSTAEPAVV